MTEIARKPRVIQMLPNEQPRAGNLAIAAVFDGILHVGTFGIELVQQNLRREWHAVRAVATQFSCGDLITKLKIDNMNFSE